jgi:hypothetical protein
VTTIRRTVLSGSAPGQIRGQTASLAPARLRDLAIQLAADPDLTVSVVTHHDGRLELEVLHTGPPHHTDETIDGQWPTHQARSRTLSIATPASLQGAIAVIRAILLDAATP